MPAVSQQQQKIMGLALSVKRGDTPRSEVSADVLKIVDSMSEKDLRKYAGTSHTGLPQKVEAKIREMVRELYKEMKSVSEGVKIKMNNLDWGKSTAERNANLDKYASLKTDKERESFLRKLKRESVNEEKVVTKKEWDKKHKDFKGMVDGEPYMMYLDPKTGATVYGPVTIKESK